MAVPRHPEVVEYENVMVENIVTELKYILAFQNVLRYNAKKSITYFKNNVPFQSFSIFLFFNPFDGLGG